MDIPECSVSTTLPPSYSEACLSPVYVAQPEYPSTPPPTYREAVGALPSAPNVTDVSPYPVLNIPTEIRTVPQTQQVIVQQAVRVEQVPRGVLRNKPAVTICPHCHQLITTMVHYKPGAAAWSMCCLLTLFGFICGVCLIPFCVRSLQDAHHTCPQCNRHIGIFTA